MQLLAVQLRRAVGDREPLQKQHESHQPISTKSAIWIMRHSRVEDLGGFKI